MDHLPFQITEELKTKNLFPFIVPEESSNNKITFLIYENQKYRPVIGSWGNVIGVHLFPAVDRRPYSNEAGNKALRQVSTFFAKMVLTFDNSCNTNYSGGLEDIQPINGFQWATGSWELIVEKGSTDDEG